MWFIVALSILRQPFYSPSAGKEADVVDMTRLLYKLEARDISHPMLNTGIDHSTSMRCERNKIGSVKLKIIVII